MNNQIIAEASIDVNEAPRQAENAQQTADGAKSLAETANNNVNNINAPEYLSPLEKLQLKIQMDSFATNYVADKDIATTEGIDFTAYEAAYQAYLAYMTPLIADMTTYSPIVRATFNSIVMAVQVEQKRFNTATQAQYSQQINQAQTDIANGQTKYQALQSEAKIMESSVAGISDAADRAISSAGFASNTASAASQAASAASQAASSALASAMSAESNASSAVSIANSTASEFGPVSQKADSAFSNATSAESAASSAVAKANSTASEFGKVDQKASSALTAAENAQSNANSAVAKAESTASEFGKVSQKADSAFDNAMSAQSAASTAVTQASSAASDSKDAKQIAGAVSQSYKTLTDGSTMTIAELESGLAVKLTKKDLDGYATQDWTQNKIKLTADSISGTLSSVKTTVDDQTTSINDLKADSSSFKSQFTTVNNIIGKHTTDIGTLQASSKELSSNFSSLNTDNSTNKTNISNLSQTVDGIKTDISKKIEQKDLNGYATETWTNGQIKTTADGINGTLSKKIEKTDLNGYATETWAQNKIKATADGINGTISSVKGTVDSQTTSINDLKADSNGFKDQFTKVNNTIGQHTTDIGTLQRDAKSLSSNFDSLSTDNGTNQHNISDLQQTSKEVSSTLETVQTQVQNSAVGTNLLLKTYDSFSMTGTNTVNQWQQMYALSRRLEAGTTVTLSFDAISTAPANFTIQNNANGDSGTWMGYYNPGTVDTTKKHYVATIKLDGYSQKGINIRVDNLPATTTITVSNMKLELGSNATDYSTNPADNATVTAVSKISQTVDGMQTDISKKIEQKDLNGYATQDWSNNQIKITADGINGTISSVKNTVGSHTTSINDLQADSSSFKSQFTTVNDTLGKHTTDIGTLQASSKELSSNFSSLNTDNSTNKTNISNLSQTVDGIKTDISKKIEQKDLNGYATETWTNGQIKTTADGINGTLSKKIEKTDLNGYATEDWTQNQIKITAEGIQSTVENKASSDQLTQLSDQLTNKISDLSSSTSSQFTQTGKDINGLVKKDDVVNQFNIDAGGALLSTSGNSTKIVFSSPNIIFDSKNPVQIPNVNIPGTLTGKTFDAGTITATTKINGADIEAPLIHSPNGSFRLDGNTGDIIGASIHSADNSWRIDKDGNINGATINTPTLDLGLNGTFTEDFDYTQPASLFLPKKNKGTLTFNHGVLKSEGKMQTYLNGKWGGVNDNLVFQPGMDNAQWTEVAPGYVKIDMYNQAGTTVAQRSYSDATGFYYTSMSGDHSYLGNVLQTPQVQTANVFTRYIGPDKGQLRLQIGQNGKDYGFQVGSYAGSEAVLSDFIYNSTSSHSPDIHITEGGHLVRTTSASKYKYNIKNPDIETTLGDRLLNVHLATWNDKRAVDSYAEQLSTGEEREKSSIDKYYGLIAEQLRDAGLDMFISYGKNHEIEGIQYDRAWVPLLSVIRRLNNKVNEYELRLSKLEGASK